MSKLENYRGSTIRYNKVIKNVDDITWWCIFAAFTMFLAMTFPFFGALLGFFGGFAFAPTTYFVRPTLLFLIFLHIQVVAIM
jgi:hypothetical protein